MTQYTPSRIIKPMVEFIQSYPSWEEYDMQRPRQIDTQTFTATRPTQLALDYVGSVVVTDASDIIGGRFITRQANFQLLLLQSSGDNVARTDTTDFLFDFERWVDYMNVTGETPIFGDDPRRERMWATNGMWSSQFGDQPASVYAFQIHKIYQINFLNKNGIADMANSILKD